MITIHVHHHHHDTANEVPPWARGLVSQVDLIARSVESIMSDLTKILAVVARLQAADTAAISTLTAMRDQNKQLSSQLADISKQLADLKASGGDTAAVQTAIDGIADQLSSTADAVEKAVADNPAVPNMPVADPAPSADPAPQAQQQ